MDAFLKLKQKYGFTLIEDCAQAHGAVYKGKAVGSFGDASAFSFYATKNITTGEGGVVLTNCSKIDSLTRQIINHGRDGHSTHTVLGYNFRLTNLAAGIGIEQLKMLHAWSEKRRENASFLSNRLAKIENVKVPADISGLVPVFHQYTIAVNTRIRQKMMDYLLSAGVGCGIYYPCAIYRQPLYQDMGFQQGICPEAEKAAETVLSLPVHPALTVSDLEKIASAVEGFFKTI